jgi:ABC-type Mn2+/Zn2+ transport system ATPase subunit
MILKRLKLVNYGGIYNGIGRNEIEIDFTKCKHRIVLIKGDNGSGKSTIENALKPLPEDSTAFIAGKDARREIEYIDETIGIEKLPSRLREIARIRLENRELSLKDLGQMLTPVLGKSGVNYRLKKIEQIAVELMNKASEPSHD